MQNLDIKKPGSAGLDFGDRPVVKAEFTGYIARYDKIHKTLTREILRDIMSQSETVFALGEDLYDISVTELESRLGLLRSETLRIEAELAKKQKDLSHAQKLFKG